MTSAGADQPLIMGFEQVECGRVELFRRGPVALIRMNRPDKRNALDKEQIAALRSGLDWFASSADAHAAVLFGAGNSFCAGGDIEMFQSINADSAWDYTRIGYDLLRPLETGRKPIVAAVSGYCLAGGLELALACDFIIADESASFGLAEVNLGLIPGWGGTVRIAQALPTRLARQIVWTCERLNADRARAAGLVNEVVSLGAAVSRAIELADRIASQPPLAVQAAKVVINSIAPATDELLALEGSLSAGLFTTTAVSERVSDWVANARAKSKK